MRPHTASLLTSLQPPPPPPSSLRQYVDESSDVITVSTDEELAEALLVFRELGKTVAKFTIEPPPTAKPKPAERPVTLTSLLPRTEGLHAALTTAPMPPQSTTSLSMADLTVASVKELGDDQWPTVSRGWLHPVARGHKRGGGIGALARTLPLPPSPLSGSRVPANVGAGLTGGA